MLGGCKRFDLGEMQCALCECAGGTPVLRSTYLFALYYWTRSRRAWPTTTPAGGRNWWAGSWIGGALGGWLRSRRCDRRLHLPGAG